MSFPGTQSSNHEDAWASAGPKSLGRAASAPGYGHPMSGAGTSAGIEHADSSDVWLRHTLEEILSQVRVLLDIDGCAFQTVDWEHGHISPAAAWFETPAIRAALQPVLDRPYDIARGGVTEAAIERGEPLLISDIERWDGAPALRARLREQLDEAAAETAWAWYRASTFISCPVRTASGRTLGVLAMSAAPPRPPLGPEQLRVTEVFAGLAGLALERTELLEREARRAATEERLHRAAQRITASLDLDAVYTAIVEQAALLANVPMAMLLRLDDVTQTLRCVASKGASDRIVAHRYEITEGMVGAVATGGEPYVSRAEDRGRFLPWVEAEGVRSFAHVPVELGPRRFGVLSVADPKENALGDDCLALLESLAGAAAAAIANALEFQHERRIAQRADARLHPRRAARAGGLLARARLRAGRPGGLRRRRLRRLAPARRGAGGARRRRQRQGHRGRRGQRDGALLHRGADVGRRRPRAGARPGQRDPAPAAARAASRW